jgi:hypothetical protein
VLSGSSVQSSNFKLAKKMLSFISMSEEGV